MQKRQNARKVRRAAFSSGAPIRVFHWVVVALVAAACATRRLIPSRVDQDRLAHCRSPMDMMLDHCCEAWTNSEPSHGVPDNLTLLPLRLDSQLSRRNCQMVSTGLNSGHWLAGAGG
jgi:hypothetical protein